MQFDLVYCQCVTLTVKRALILQLELLRDKHSLKNHALTEIIL